MQRRFFLALLLCILQAAGTFAEERVARLQITQDKIKLPYHGPTIQIETIAYNQYTLTPPQSIDSVTFKVYTTDELDQKLGELRGMVLTLRQNIKDLADINDALTKRLNELEKSKQTESTRGN